jgi:hypothetical protein
MISENKKNVLITELVRRFPTFGGGEITPGNPVSYALKDEEPQFAAGIEIGHVIDILLGLIDGSMVRCTNADICKHECGAKFLHRETDCEPCPMKEDSKCIPFRLDAPDFQVGDFCLRILCDGKVWITYRGGEGMACRPERFEAAISKFYNTEF